MTAWEAALANFQRAKAEYDRLPSNDPTVDAANELLHEAMDDLFDVPAGNAAGLDLKVSLAKARFDGFGFPDDLLDTLIADARRMPAVADWDAALAKWREANLAYGATADIYGKAAPGSADYITSEAKHGEAFAAECRTFAALMAIPAENLGVVAAKFALLDESDRLDSDCSREARLIFADVQRLAAEEARRIPT